MGETTFKTLRNWRWLYSMNFTQTSLRRRDEDYILWCFKIISVKYIPPFVTVIRCYKNGRHQDCDTTENESRTRDLYLYLFYTKYGKKSCIFRGQAGFFFNCIDDTHNRFQFHTQSKKNIQFSGSFNFFVGQFQRSDCYQIRI